MNPLTFQSPTNVASTWFRGAARLKETVRLSLARGCAHRCGEKVAALSARVRAWNCRMFSRCRFESDCRLWVKTK